MARKKRTGAAGGLTDSFKSHWFAITLQFLKDDTKLSLQYPKISHTQAEYICSLIRPNIVKTWVGSKPEYTALYEALIIFGLKFEFKLSLVGENSKSILLTKIPKNEKKTEDQTSEPQTNIDSIMDALKSHKVVDKLTHSFMLETTQMILNFIEDKTRATLEIKNVKPLECLFLQCAMTAAKPLFPEHSKLLSYAKMLAPSQDFYLKVDVVKLHCKGKSALRNVTFTKVPKFGTEPKDKTNFRKRRKRASKAERSSKIVESCVSKTLDNALNSGNNCSNSTSNKLDPKSVNSIRFISSITESVSNKTSQKMDLAQTSMSKISCLTEKPLSSALSMEKRIPQANSTASDCNLHTVSQKLDMTSNSMRNLKSITNSVPSNSKLLRSNGIVSKSSQCDCSISVVSQVLETSHTSSTDLQKDTVADSSTSEKIESNNDYKNSKALSKNVLSSENISSVSINLTDTQVNDTTNTAELKSQKCNCFSFKEDLQSCASNIDYGCVDAAGSPKTNVKSNSSSTENLKSPDNSCSVLENVESHSNSSKSICVSTSRSSKRDLKSPNSSFTENTKSNNCSILKKFLNDISFSSRNLGSPKTSYSAPDLTSIFKTTADGKIISERTTGKSILSRSVPDLRVKIQNIQSARSESVLNDKLAYEDIFGNINKPFYFENPYESPQSMLSSRNSVLGSRNSMLEKTSSGMESNLVRTVSTPILTPENMCKNSINGMMSHNMTIEMMSQNLGASSSGSYNSTPKDNLVSLKSLPTREWYRSELESSIFESSTELMSTHSASILDVTREMSTSLDRGKATNKSKVRTRGRPSVKDTRKTELMEALSVPVHIEKSARMMKIMGYRGGPLGLRGEGITEPIMPSLDLVNRAGLGYAKVESKRNPAMPKQGAINNSSGSNVIPSLMGINPLNIDIQNSKGQQMTKKAKFRITLLKAVFELITTDVATVKVAYNRVAAKQRGFVKVLLKALNERRNTSFGTAEEQLLFAQLKAAMNNSPWHIEGSDTLKYVTLRKVSSKDTLLKKEWLKSEKMVKTSKDTPLKKEQLRPAKSGEAPRYSISSEGLATGPDAFDDNDTPIVYITDKRLNYYVNNVSIPKIDGYPQTCTLNLAFRLTILDELLEFSKSDDKSMIIDITVNIDKDERKFINKLIRPKPCFQTQLEKDTYEDIAFMTYKQNSFLHMEFTDQMKLIVNKLLDNSDNRKLSRQRHRKAFLKNINSNDDDDNTSVTNNNDNITKVTTQSNDNMPNIYIINQNDKIQIQITKDAIENIKYKISDQTTVKKEDDIMNINESNDKSAITIKKDVISNNYVKLIDIKKNSDVQINESDNIINVNENVSVKTEQNEDYACDKPIVIDISGNNDIKILNENDKENELLKSEADDVILVDQIDEIILLSDEEAEQSENLSTVNKAIESAPVTTEENVNGELTTHKETSVNTETSEIADNIDVKIINSKSSYSDIDFEKELHELELLELEVIDEIDDNNKTKVLVETETGSSNEPKTRKRSRTDSDLSSHDSKKSKTNVDGFKTVTIVPVNKEDKITQESALKIQTLISDTIDKSNELPLLKCHGIKDGRLVYSCHDKKSYLFMEKCFNTADFKMLDTVTIEDKCYKLKIRLNTLMDNVTSILNKLGQYNAGLDIEKWRVTEVLKNCDHIIILVEVDTDSFKFLNDNSFSLYAGVDVARFSLNWD